MSTLVDNGREGGSKMKALLTLRICALALFGLLTAACTLFQFTPSLSLTVQSSDYTTSKIDIPYSFATLSRSSGIGSAECDYRLERYDSYGANFNWVTGNQSTMPSEGTLSFPLETLLGLASGSTAVDGLYRLSFAVLSGNYDQSGNPIPIPYLTKSVTFKVHTFAGPEIFRVSPPLLNPNNGTSTMVVDGSSFTSVDSLMDTVGAVTGQYVDSATMKATVNTGSLAAGNNLSIFVSNPVGNSSPNFDIPIVGPISVSSVVPNGDSRTNSNLQLYITGQYLSYWTKVTITDSSGHTATMHVNNAGSNYIYGTIDLTPLSSGAATLTAVNPDGVSPTNPWGTPATTSFTVYN